MKAKLALAVFVAVSLVGCGPTTRAGKIATTTGVAASGSTLYSANCASCHGADGKGTASGPTLVEPTKNDGAEEVLSYIINGKTGTAMPSFATLSDQQIADIYAHMKATFK